jgi:hypothetical protein
MKNTSIFAIIFLLSNHLSAQYIENFHDCATSFQGYWSCENRKGYELIDISGKNNHGFYKNVFHEKGRHGRLYSNGKAFIDSTGITRTCINLNGGYGQVNGICFECDSARYNKLIKFQAYIKRDSNSFGVIASFGDSINGNGLILHNGYDSTNSKDSAFLIVMKNHKSVGAFKVKFVVNLWYYAKIHIATDRPGSIYNESIYFLFHDAIEKYEPFINTSYKSMPFLTKMPNLGWSGFMCLGKNGFTGQINNKGLWVDDIGIGNSEKGGSFIYLDECYDRGISTNTLKYNALNLYPNPVSDILNIESANTILREYSQYEIYALDGRKKQCGSLSNSINVQELPPGVYSLKIGSFVSKFVKMN